MSDPMTNAEMEDVLSSIRRLVSDEKPAEPVGEEAPAPDRLVLTPSLRVDDTPNDDTDTSEPMAEDLQDVESAPYDQGDDDAGALKNFLFEHRARTADPSKEAVEESDPNIEAEDTPWGDVAQYSDDDASDIVEHDDIVADDFEDTEDDTEEVMFSHAETDDHDTAPAHSLSDKIAALETLVAGRSDEWEPDDPGADAYAGTEAPTIAWEDAHQEAEPHVEPEPELDDNAEASADEDDAQILADEDDLLDEEALRDIVSEIVREELQGALGERITRNVRKLVRREIHRALAAQELD